MKCPDQALVDQVLAAPDSVRFSTVVTLDSETGKIESFWVVMSDADGKVLGKHQFEDFQAVVLSFFRVAKDAAKFWPEQAASMGSGNLLVKPDS